MPGSGVAPDRAARPRGAAGPGAGRDPPRRRLVRHRVGVPPAAGPRHVPARGVRGGRGRQDHRPARGGVRLPARAPRPSPGRSASTTGTEVLSVRSLRTVDGEGLDVVREWVPADLAGPVSRADATGPGIWETLTRQRAPHRHGPADHHRRPGQRRGRRAARRRAGRRAAARPPARRRRRPARPSRCPTTATSPSASPSRSSSAAGPAPPRPPSPPASAPSAHRRSPSTAYQGAHPHEGPRHRRRRVHRLQLRPPRPRRPGRTGRSPSSTPSRTPATAASLAAVADRDRVRGGRRSPTPALVDTTRRRRRRRRPLRRRVAQRQLARRPVAVHRVQHHRDVPAARGGAPARQADAPHLDRRGLRRPRARRPGPLHRVDAGQPVEPVLVDQGERRPAGARLDPVASGSRPRCRTARTTTGPTSTSRSSSRARSPTSCRA